jgi:glycosyltransferase involved in cell wall biosynthesis
MPRGKIESHSGNAGGKERISMKVVLVLFEQTPGDAKHGFGFASSRLAQALLDADLLGGVIALQRDKNFDPGSVPVRVLSDDRFFHLAMALANRIASLFPSFGIRATHEKIFDRFACRQIKWMKGDLLFFFRPLFPRAVKLGKRLGLRTWIQASIPHPLVNFELVGGEESRLGLPRRGAYSDPKRAKRLAATIGSSDRLLCMDREVGQYTYDTYARFLDQGKIIPVKHMVPIDPAEFASVAESRNMTAVPSRGVRFLHVSHMNLIKGIPYLLDAWRLLKQEDGQEAAILTLVGQRDENLDKVIQRDYADLPGLQLTGWAPDLIACLGEADVFISPSISDNGPGTIVEAMAAGLPVISSLNCGCASLITPGKDGFTYPFADVDRLAELLLWFTNNQGAIARMGEQARAKISKSSADRYADELVAIIQSAGEESTHGR